ncbi:MAG: hypothetical protein KGN84_02900 [Acidobacteriota bacterium]|nr:hypothetical protein [Acidobacteriota bacterium]
MKKQIWRDGMPRRFDSIGVDVADKPGALDHLRGDVGSSIRRPARWRSPSTVKTSPKPIGRPTTPGTFSSPMRPKCWSGI